MYAIFVHLLEPYPFLMLSLALVTTWTWWSSRPRRRTHAVAGTLAWMLVVLSAPMISDLAYGTLEAPYPMTGEVPAAGDTIVVLGGNLKREWGPDLRVRLGNSSLNRCLYAARLYKQAGGCRMVLAGGPIEPTLPDAALATVMRDFLVEMGVRPEDLVLESASTTTFENARNTKPLLETAGDARIWLVTEAMHMRRSERCFLAQGIPVTPAACDHKAAPSPFTPGRLVPTSRAIMSIDQVAHEWTGLFWYWLRGRI